MKHIDKGSEPARLRQWRLAQSGTPQNLAYVNIPGPALAEMRAALLHEQGRLCAYTMLRIRNPKGGHIEHIEPQSRRSDLQVDYANMVYCYPGDAVSCEFGARRKGNAEGSTVTFLSPLDVNCERRLTFENDGAVSQTDANDRVAEDTLKLLDLGNAYLTNARKTAILALPIFRKGANVTAAEARRLARQSLARDANGDFPPFALALNQALTRYAKKQAARATALRTQSER